MFTTSLQSRWRVVAAVAISLALCGCGQATGQQGGGSGTATPATASPSRAVASTSAAATAPATSNSTTSAGRSVPVASGPASYRTRRPQQGRAREQATGSSGPGSLSETREGGASDAASVLGGEAACTLGACRMTTRGLARELAARAGIAAPRVTIVGWVAAGLAWSNARINSWRSEMTLHRQLLGLGEAVVAAALAHDLGHSFLNGEAAKVVRARPGDRPSCNERGWGRRPRIRSTDLGGGATL